MAAILFEQSLIIAQLLLKYGPGVAESVAVILGKGTVTMDDWTAVFARAKTPFDQGLNPGVLIQPEPTTTQPPPS